MLSIQALQRAAPARDALKVETKTDNNSNSTFKIHQPQQTVLHYFKAPLHWPSLAQPALWDRVLSRLQHTEPNLDIFCLERSVDAQQRTEATLRQPTSINFTPDHEGRLHFLVMNMGAPHRGLPDSEAH